MKSIQLLQSFQKAHKIYLESMEDLKKEYQTYSFGEEMILNNQESFFFHFKKNFFTLLMISILLEAKLSKERVVSYSKIIFSLRAMITATDNIIDRENKSIVQILGLPEEISQNMFISILHQHILEKEILKLTGKITLFQKLLEKIYDIAKAESLRENSLYQSYPSFQEIEEKIHSGIGGDLLAISLWLPIHLEENEILSSYQQALYEIGMSLQALDDLTDIEEDKEKGKVNLAEAYFQENSWEESTKKAYVYQLLDRAFQGFQILEENHYPMDKRGASYLLKKLFVVRKVESYYTEVLEHYLKENKKS